LRCVPALGRVFVRLDPNGRALGRAVGDALVLFKDTFGGVAFSLL
jgi:hypothetical protein